MELTLEFWFMLPVAVLVSTVAMASGVEGATFFTPAFILALGLAPEVAVGAGLITETFGLTSGVTAYARKRLIDYRLGAGLLIVTVPAALVGTWAVGYVEADVLKGALGMGLLILGVTFLRSPHAEPDGAEASAPQEADVGSVRCLATRDLGTVCYRVCRRAESRVLAGVGALFLGMVSTGLGEVNGYVLLRRCRVPGPVAIASSVLVVAVTALAASASHVGHLVHAGGPTLGTVLSLVMFTVPGVIMGGQLGPRAAGLLSQRALERALAVLFLGVAALMLADVLR